MLEARRLCYQRDGLTLFHDLSLTVNGGEWLQITGANGAGKTTLLRTLIGLSQPDSGEILWQGCPLVRDRARFHGHLLWTGHRPAVKAVLTGVENLQLYYPGITRTEAIGALGNAGLVGDEDIPVGQLSAGQQQRVALARLWLTRAALWVLDEPVTALDGVGISALTGRLAEHTRRGGAVIFTSHQPLPVPSGQIRTLGLTNGGPR